MTAKVKSLKLYILAKRSFVSRKINGNGELFKISQVVWFQDKLGVYYQIDFKEIEFKSIYSNKFV